MENSKHHILIVDDDDRIRNLLKDYLTENNYIVSAAENALQAKEKLQYLKFDIIILDVMMPGQNGYELTKEIKQTLKRGERVELRGNFGVFYTNIQKARISRNPKTGEKVHTPEKKTIHFKMAKDLFKKLNYEKE